MAKNRGPEIHIPPGAMVDTMVLIHAVKVPDPKRIKSERRLHEARELHQSYRWLIKAMSPLRVSAVTWIEFLRFDPKAEHAKLLGLVSSIDVVAVDDEVAALAAALLHAKYKTPDVCPKCLAHMSERATPCGECKTLKAPRQHHVDATVVASAAVVEAPVLYSHDTALVGLAALLPSDKVCRVEEPPNTGGPLGEWAKRRQRA